MRNYTEIPTISDQQLKFWSNARVNVLIYGDHGVGKTSIIKNFWDSLDIKYAMFSGATLDPWTDLVGIPYKVGEDGDFHIEYAIPKIMDSELEAIFIDEINRAPAKVRNALMELLLTKSINGRKFPKLKYIWAAANPPDSNNNYDVEELDPAQEDRFEVIVRLSDKPYQPFFASKYGNTVAEKAVAWHNNLADDIRALVSPRRLDFALDYVVIKGGNPRDVFPHKSINVTAFAKAVKGDKRMEELAKLIADKDDFAIRDFFTDQAKVQGCLKDILRDSYYAKYLGLYGDMEQLIGIVEADKNVSIWLAEAQREDKDQAIDDYRQMRGFDPAWHTEGVNRSAKARSATALFVRELEDNFPKVSPVDVKITDLVTLLDSKDENDVLEDFQYPKGLLISPVDRDSAINGMKFAINLFQNGLVNTMVADNQAKVFSILYSSLNFYYERDGNLVGAFYDVPGLDIAVRTLPNAVKPARPSAPQRASRAGKGRGNGGVSLGEEIL